jgi:hypothetical protein
MRKSYCWVGGAAAFLAFSPQAQPEPGLPWVRVSAGPPNVQVTHLCLTDAGNNRVIDIFATGANHYVYRNAWNPANQTLYGDWEKVPHTTVNEPYFDDAAACGVINGELTVFGRATAFSYAPHPAHAPNTIMMIQSKGGDFTKSDWSPLPGGGTTDAPLGAFGTSSTLVLLSKGINDKRLYENVLAGGQWAGWTLVDPAATTVQGPAVVVLKDMVFAFAIGVNDKRAYMNKRTLTDRTWSGWTPVPGNKLFYEPLAATTDGVKTVTILGIDHQPVSGGPIMANKFHIRVNAADLVGSDTWSGWKDLPGGGQSITSPATAVGYVAMLESGNIYLQPVPE